jgi:hypothetical protein
MVFGLMAFSASAAQAEVGAKWLFAEKAPNSGLVAFLDATAELENDSATYVLHSKIAGIAVLILCTNISGTVGLRTAGGLATGTVLTFSNCIVHLNGTTSKACEPNNEGKEPGVIKTKPGHGLIALAELAGGVKHDVVRILPDTGETFATIEMSAECAIGSKIPVIGKAVIKDCENLSLTHLVKHLIELGSKTEGTELWVISKTVEHEATILGSAWVKLIGSHLGLKFSGDPA